MAILILVENKYGANSNKDFRASNEYKRMHDQIEKLELFERLDIQHLETEIKKYEEKHTANTGR